MPTPRQNAESQFPTDIAQHQMTTLRDDGLYRHLRFRRPGTGNMGFDIITWPGYLAYVGDMGSYVFARLEDMFVFFRDHNINPSYWAEKVEAAEIRDGIEEYSPDTARAWVKEQLDSYVATDEIRAEAANIDFDNGAFRLYDQLDAIEFNGFSDHWEADFNEYTFPYIWCCLALVWAIKKYDLVKSTSCSACGGAGSNAMHDHGVGCPACGKGTEG